MTAVSLLKPDRNSWRSFLYVWMMDSDLVDMVLINESKDHARFKVEGSGSGSCSGSGSGLSELGLLGGAVSSSKTDLKKFMGII